MDKKFVLDVFWRISEIRNISAYIFHTFTECMELRTAEINWLRLEYCSDCSLGRNSR
jgi:hypothetical protein